ESISIRDDEWIPESVDYRIHNKVTNSSIIKVSDLILHETRQWMEELITGVFSSKDAERILCIPLA
ncbi:hypothetical protein Godav_000940, partial [Gossypium davidsonii]|nr:hypothetical protein [Gossypium davidsonii]MBA0667907.1 hypothetical protein [Gossypium klotzschianum]